ncbi:hypothetical protein HNP46_000482 [Pseudomonas nitritireducens]|uniref:Arc-like DNA binding domain-containing protein n=1 Tax=Pseudomonas nitroreducens TaxID=46680 RepID=A0A7W7KF23_PSENT|nr:Arc family DNA-binding protein [Pseudomonas nitritireducens]MBB4861671.1 hypothetical protein [Pseudomonas nitritireducens]
MTPEASTATPLDYERITLRIPKDLHALLSESAEQGSTSMNAEIIQRLRSTFEPADGTFSASDRAKLDALCAHLGVTP